MAQGGFITKLNSSTSTNFALNTSVTTITSITSFVGEVIKFSLPEVGITDIDVSTMDSTDNYMEYIGGSADPGSIELELNYNAANDDKLIDIFGSVPETWHLTFPDNSRWSCSGYINKLGGGTAGPNEKITRTIGIKCSGKPTHRTSL